MNNECSSRFGNDYEIFSSDVQYSKCARLGSGGFGCVYKGLYKDVEVAVKEIIKNENNEKSLTNEINSLKQLKHPNIIVMYGHYTREEQSPDEPKKIVCIVMEFMENGSLYDLLHTQKQLRYKADHVFSWACQCADAVRFLHSQPKKLIYRDLKSANLLLKNKYRDLKIGDFGSTRSLRSSDTVNTGTATYMAPEVFISKKYDEKCDVYSFGIVLWEVITRQYPYQGLQLYNIQWNVADKNLRPPSIVNCSEELNDLMKRCWNGEPAERPTMKEVFEKLSEHKEKYPNGHDELMDEDVLKKALRTKHELIHHLQQLREIKRLKLRRDKLRTALEKSNKIPDNNQNISENN